MKVPVLNKINFIWKYLCAFFLIAAVSLCFQREIYQQSFEGEEICGFLPEGEYMLTVAYADVPEDADFALVANSLVTPENKQGLDLISERLPAGSGTLQFMIDVPSEARNVFLSSEYVTGWSLQGVKPIDNDNYFLAALFFILAVGALVYGALFYRKSHNMVLMLIGIGVLASFPLFGRTLPYNTDILFHFGRVNGIYEGLRTGQFPVRINPTQLEGYGYITGTMYPQLFLYIPAVLKFLQVSSMLGMQLLIFIANLATPLFTYAAVRSMIRHERIAFLAAAFYTLNPYRLIIFYNRGAIGEGLAMVFLPLILWGTYEILWNRKEKWWILALGMTGVLGAHLLSLELYAVLIFGEMVLWIFSGNKDDILKRLLAMGKAALYTILLNLSFLGPFLSFAKLNPMCFRADFHEDLYTLDLVRAFEPFAKWGDVYQPLNKQAFMSVTLGCTVLIGIALFGILMLKQARGGGGEIVGQGKRYLVLGSLFFVVSLWIIPWKQLLEIEWLYRTLGAIQFPWRTFGVTAVLFSIVAAIAVTLWEEQKEWTDHRYLSCLMLCILLLECGGYFGNIAHSAQMIEKMDAQASNFTDDLYLCDNSLPGYFYTVDFSHITCDVEEHFSHLGTQNAGPGVICKEPENIVWTNYRKSGLHISADVFSEYAFSASLPLHQYPGYHIWVDGEETETYSVHSLLTCDIPEGTHHIEAEWIMPFAFRVCDAAGLCVIAVSLLWWISGRSRRAGNRKDKES